MEMNIKKWFILGSLFIIIVGTLLHFVYEWSGNNEVVGIFGAVNESTWEHLKLLFWPSFIFSIIEYIYIGNRYNNYITAKAISFFVGIFLIVSLFYTYTGVIGSNYFIIDILIFIISVLVSQYVGYKITTSDIVIPKIFDYISVIAIMLLVLGFTVFTFNPPQIPLFEDPITGNFGI